MPQLHPLRGAGEDTEGLDSQPAGSSSPAAPETETDLPVCLLSQLCEVPRCTPGPSIGHSILLDHKQDLRIRRTSKP